MLSATARVRMIGAWEWGGFYRQGGRRPANGKRGGGGDPLVAKGWVGG